MNRGCTTQAAGMWVTQSVQQQSCTYTLRVATCTTQACTPPHLQEELALRHLARQQHARVAGHIRVGEAADLPTGAQHHVPQHAAPCTNAHGVCHACHEACFFLQECARAHLGTFGHGRMRVLAGWARSSIRSVCAACLLFAACVRAVCCVCCVCGVLCVCCVRVLFVCVLSECCMCVQGGRGGAGSSGCAHARNCTGSMLAACRTQALSARCLTAAPSTAKVHSTCAVVAASK